ncbi:MAG: GntR family transcriptional regulator [Desulfobacterales bacterium]|nr:MAG: GntR family transcriptional regulator [Desulfobacterales bacterium]
MPNRNLRKEQDKILGQFENLILTGIFKPRERLVEADLAQKLNVSRYWVRDALKILESKGLVQIIPYKGAVVSDLSEKEIEDIFVIRVALERLALRLAMRNFKPANIKVLKKLAKHFEVHHRNENTQEMMHVNAKFHDYIFELSGNPTLVQMIVDMRTRLHILRYAAWSNPEILVRIVAEHQEYIRAFEVKDLGALEQLTEKHIGYSKDFYLSRLKAIREIIPKT